MINNESTYKSLKRDYVRHFTHQKAMSLLKLFYRCLFSRFGNEMSDSKVDIHLPSSEYEKGSQPDTLQTTSSLMLGY